MFKRVMLPTDFSRYGGRAATYAVWLARQSGGTVHVVHVVDNPADSLYEPEEVPLWVMVEHAGKKAQELLEAFAKERLPADCPRELHVLHGDPYAKLMEAVKTIAPDAIVMSTHGRSGIAHLVIGSVAEKLVRHATCPVFVARRGA